MQQKSKQLISVSIILLSLLQFFSPVLCESRQYVDLIYHEDKALENENLEAPGCLVYQNDRVFKVSRSILESVAFVVEITNPLKPTARGEHDLGLDVNDYVPNTIVKDGKTYIRFGAKGGVNYIFEFKLQVDVVSLTLAKQIAVPGYSNSAEFKAQPIEIDGSKHYASINGQIKVHDFADWDNVKTFSITNYYVDESDAHVVYVDGKPYIVGISNQYKFFMMDVSSLDVTSSSQKPKLLKESDDDYPAAIMDVRYGGEITFQNAGKTHCAFWAEDQRRLFIVELTPQPQYKEFFSIVKQVPFDVQVLGLLFFNIGGSSLYAQISQKDEWKSKLYHVDQQFDFTEKESSIDTLYDLKDGHLAFYQKRVYTIWFGTETVNVFEILLSSCPANQQIDGANPFQCINCSFPCQDCDDYDGFCSTCVDSYPPRDPTKQCQCPTNYTDYNQNSQCARTECDQYCKLCDPHTKKCFECGSSTTELVRGVCSCKTGFQQSILNPYGDFCDPIATKCNDPRCLKCNTDQLCFLLKSGENGFLVNGSILSCKMECETCDDIYQCLTCKTPNLRTGSPLCQCKKGLNLKNGQCYLPTGELLSNEFNYEKYLEDKAKEEQQQQQNGGNGQNINRGGTNSGDSTQVKKKNDDEDNETVLLAVLIPICLVCLIALSVTVFFVQKVKKQMIKNNIQQMKQAELLGEEPMKKGSMINKQYRKQPSEMLPDQENQLRTTNKFSIQNNEFQKQEKVAPEPFTQKNIEIYSRQQSVVSVSEQVENNSPSKKLIMNSSKGTSDKRSSLADKQSTAVELNVIQHHNSLGYPAISTFMNLKESEDGASNDENEEEEEKKIQKQKSSKISSSSSGVFSLNRIGSQNEMILESQTSINENKDIQQLKEEEEEDNQEILEIQENENDNGEEEEEEDNNNESYNDQESNQNQTEESAENQNEEEESARIQNENEEQKTVLIQQKDRLDEIDLQSQQNEMEQDYDQDQDIDVVENL